MKLVRYQPSTGRILKYLQTDQWQNTPPSWTDGSEAGKDIATLEVTDDIFVDIASVYVTEGKVTPRPVFTPVVPNSTIPADGTTEFEITGIPAPCDVSLFGTATDQWQETSGTVTLTTNIIGEYKVYIEAFPYQRTEVKFNAT
jgi:hypothetical protein